MAPLSKEQSRARWSELRTIFCKWDPIGVMDNPEWPRDEYDCMVGPVLRMLEADAPEGDIANLRREITDHFGLSPESYDFASVARQAKSWFRGHADGT